MRTRTCAYQGVRNISFSENFTYALNDPQNCFEKIACSCFYDIVKVRKNKLKTLRVPVFIFLVAVEIIDAIDNTAV